MHYFFLRSTVCDAGSVSVKVEKTNGAVVARSLMLHSALIMVALECCFSELAVMQGQCQSRSRN